MAAPKKIELKRSEYLEHYGLAIIPLIFPILDGYYRIRGIQMVNALSLTGYLLIAMVSAIIIYFKWKELNYDTYYISRNAQQFIDSVKASAIQMKWKIIKLNETGAIATTHDQWAATNNLKIHIHRTDEKVEIQSRVLPVNLMSGPDIFLSRRRTVSTFLDIYEKSATANNIIQSVKKEIRKKEIKVENVNEWNVESILKRIFAYIFCLAFIAIAYFILNEEFNFAGVFLGLIGSSYIVLDIYIIIKKMRASS